jgi:hypothetical protein
MKKLILLSMTMCLTALSFAQPQIQYSDGFSFKITEESQPKLILADSYNTFLLSNIDINGILSKHELIVRKFDQKNQLIETYKQAMPKIDDETLYNYIGSATIPGNKKEVIFTESYSGKSDKQDLYQHVFDKTTGIFTTTLIKSFPMENTNKKGVFEMQVSENNRYIGIFSSKNSTKKEAVQSTVLMLDAAAPATLWTKDVTLESKDYERSFTVTNSGKAVLLRGAKGFKISNFLTVVTADKAEDKALGEEVQLQDPKAVSIGSQDYLIGFDHDAKGLRAGDFEKFMLYDLDAGKMINNSKIAVLNNAGDVVKATIKNVFIQNNEFHIFAEARVKAGTRPVKVNQFSTMTMDEPYYRNGPAFLIVMDFEGKIKSTTALNVSQNPLADSYSSFGLANVKGDYRIIGGGSEIYKLSPGSDFKINPKETVRFRSYDNTLESSLWWNWNMVPHLFAYLPDSKKFVVGRYYNDQLSLITVSDL